MVVVRYNPLTSATNVAALKYADTIHRVSKVVETPLGAYYELEGVTGKNNVPYAFARSDLELVK
jgi:hypothetical protein